MGKGNKSKNIGKAFEREVAKKLSAFFGLSFQRIPNSGSFIGGANAYRIHDLSDSQILLARGDLIPPDELYNLIIECKKRKEIPYHQFFQDKGCKELNEWIDQVEIDFNECSRIGLYLLIFKSKRQATFTCFLRNCGLKYSHNHVNYMYKNMRYVITELNTDFLTVNKDYIFEKCSLPKDTQPVNQVLDVVSDN